MTKGTGNSQVRFVGTIGRSTLPAGEENYLFLGSGDNLYYPASGDVTSMKGFRAYFIVDSETSTDIPRHAPARLVIAPKMPTAVDQVQGDNVQSTKDIKIEGLRGIGTLTNIKGEKARFNGRKLDTQEMSVVPGEIGGKPWVITVKAEDGSSTHVYKIKVVKG